MKNIWIILLLVITSILTGCSKEEEPVYSGLTFEGYAHCGIAPLHKFSSGGQVKGIEYFRFYVETAWGYMEVDVPEAGKKSSFSTPSFQEGDTIKSIGEKRWIKLVGFKEGQTYVDTSNNDIYFEQDSKNYEPSGLHLNVSHYDHQEYINGDLTALKYEVVYIYPKDWFYK